MYRISLLLLCVATMLSSCDNGENKSKLSSPIGELSFTHDFANGYPLKETQEALLESIDFQRGCQTYLWSLPLVAMAQWQYAHNHQIGAENGQIVYFKEYMDKLGGLTFNATTPYVISIIDLNQGPWVLELPKGEMIGGAIDFWQRSFAQFEPSGKYVISASDDACNIPTGFKSLKSPTMNVLLGFRIVSEEPFQQTEMLNATKIYPLSEINNPKPRGWISPEGKSWQGCQPAGLDYWARLADIINRENIHERDRFFMAMLKPLGIEKEHKFNPNEYQKRILTQAALVGEAMAKANDFHNDRIKESIYMEGSNWEYATTCPPNQRYEHYECLDGRAAWFYEAVTNGPDMHGHKTGKGQVYMAAYTDQAGAWLDGACNYKLHLPADVPVEKFWSLTVYDVSSRALIHNEMNKADLSSRMNLKYNPDGSVDLYIGPRKPSDESLTDNWIQTSPGKSWFTYFRLYGPKKEFMTKEWILLDIKKIGIKRVLYE